MSEFVSVIYYLGLFFLWMVVGIDTLMLMQLTHKKRYIATWGMMRLVPLIMVTIYGKPGF